MTQKRPIGQDRSRLLPLDEVAAELGVCTKTVRRQITAGVLIAHRMGRCLRVSAEDLDRYRNRCRA